MDIYQESSGQEQATQYSSLSNVPQWVTPTFEVIEVSMECTAYAGTADSEE